MEPPLAVVDTISFTRFFFFFLLLISSWSRPPPFASATDFLFNSFAPQANLLLVGDARVDSSVIRLTNDSNQFSIGRAFYPLKLNTTADTTNATSGSGALFSFSTSFVFSVLPEIPSSPGFGFAFVLSSSTSPPGALSGQYFGLFSNSTRRSPAPLFAVEFDTGRNPEFNDPDGNHVGIDLNYIESSATATAGYYTNTSNASFVPIDMRSGANVRAWVEFDGSTMRIDVTLAPAGADRKPPRTLLSYTDPAMREYLSPEMYVGFSASKVTWVEAQRVLAWSFSDTGRPARDINTTGFPVFLPPPAPRRKAKSKVGLVVGVTLGAVAALGLCVAVVLYYYFRAVRRRTKKKRGKIGDDDQEAGFEDDGVEEWEMEFWPRRFEYADLLDATDGFARDRMLGYGGFGKVYKGVLKPQKKPNPDSEVGNGDSNPDAGDKTQSVGANDGSVSASMIAVKVVAHDSKQGLREFMAEISSMGRLQHKNLVPMRGWCRRRNELMLVYDYMPNGSLNRWIFGTHNASGTSGSGNATASSSTSSFAGDRRPSPASPSTLLGWEGRKRILADVAEGLLYLHQGWDKVVLHRDVKPSNILLDGNMRGRLGDFGLAKLHGRGETPGVTRVVGTLGYLAPELARVPAPTPASDVYSYGVVVLETCCGRRAIEMLATDVDDEDFVLVDWARGLYTEGRIAEAADRRVVVSAAEVAEAELVVKLGLACCHPDPDHRPTMKEVVDVLLGVLDGRGASHQVGESSSPSLMKPSGDPGDQ